MAEKELSILVKAKGAAAAARDVGKVDTAVGKLGKNATSSLGRLGKSAESSLGTLKGRVSGLAGALGPLVGVGGLLGLTGLLASSVTKADEFGASVAKVAAITGMATPIASAFTDTLEKFGVEGDALVSMLGKMEKNVGLIAGAGTAGKDTTEARTKATEELALAQLRLREIETKGGASASQILAAQQRVATEKRKKSTDGLRLAELKLHEVESKGGASASSLLAAHQRVADAQRKLTAVQKDSGKGVSGAAAFQKQYGFSLTDSSGKIADANTLLQRSADYFNSNATASNKATVMAKLWGKSWQDLIPVLSKGSDAIRKEEAGAIKLTDAQLDNMTKFRTAQRDFADSFGDLQVKIGAEVMPLLTTGLSEASAWFDSHGDEVSGFFRDAAKFAGDAAKSAGEVFSGIKAGWESIPGPLREFLVKGVVADRTIKFLFGVSPISLAAGAVSKGLGGILGGFAQRGSSPANPVFVSGGIGGSLPGPAAGAGGAGSFLTSGFLGPATIIAAAVAATIIGSANTRAKVDEAISTGDQSALRTIAEEARKHGVSDENNAALKALNAIAHNTAPGARSAGGSFGGPSTADEKAQQRRNSVFTSNPTRKELRTKIGIDKKDLLSATGKNAVDISKHLQSLQNRLDNRIERANQQANAVAAASARAIVSAVNASKAAIPAPTVIVPVNVSFSARNAASAIAVTTIRSGNFGPADHPGGGGA